MDRDYYVEEIRGILDDAANDKELSLQDYADLCGEIWTDAQGRCEAAMNDLEKQNQ